MSYYRAYQRKMVGGLKRTTKYNLKPGQIAVFRYNNSENRDRRSFVRIVFVLNTWRDGKGTKLHGLNLENIPWIAFRDFIRVILVKDTISLLKRRYELISPVKNIVNRPRPFYSNFVKSRLGKYDCYRTYNTLSMNSPKIGYLDFRALFNEFEKKEMLISDDDTIEHLMLEKTMLEKTLNFKIDKITDRQFKQIVLERFGSTKNFVNAYKTIEDSVNELDSNSNLEALG